MLKEFLEGGSRLKRICVALSLSFMLVIFADSSTLTRTETTAGFTLETMSANPEGDCIAPAAWADVVQEERLRVP